MSVVTADTRAQVRRPKSSGQVEIAKKKGADNDAAQQQPLHTANDSGCKNETIPAPREPKSGAFLALNVLCDV